MAIKKLGHEGGCSGQIPIFEVAVLTLLDCTATELIYTAGDITQKIFGPNMAEITRMEIIVCNAECNNRYSSHNIIILQR